jgi:tetratricopeptide (TPR) repeat protein
VLPLWLQLLALTLPAPALAGPPVAVVPVDAVWRDGADKAEEPPVAVMVDSVRVRLEPGEETRVELELRLRALDPGWVDLAVTGGALAVERAQLDGREVALQSRDGGARWLTTELSGEHRLVVRGTVATPAAALDLPLPLASRARIEITEPGWDLSVDGGIPTPDGAVLLASSERLAARWKPLAAPAPKPRVVTVQSATAVSFDESGLEGHSVLRYRVAHGSLEQVSFDIAGSPDSVEVSGPAVRDFQQHGSRVTVRLARPMEGGFELQVAYRAPAPSDDRAHAAPLLSPQDVFEHKGWLTVARADTAMLVPEPGAGLSPVPGSSLPPWATGLVPGDPVVSYALSGRRQALDYRLLSYDPVAAPPTVVDEARFQLAATAHGRALMKARYTVRNDRNQYLRLQPPEGFAVLGVRVAGQVRQPVADGDAVYIPLEKSVESLQGLISFPVEVYLLGDDAAWDRKGQRSLQTPAVDAPVAYARWEVWLPTDVEWEELSGLPKHVADWTSSEHSLEYGRAVKTDEGGDDGDWEEGGGRASRSVQSRSARRSNREHDREEPKVGAASSYLKDSAAEDASLELFNQAYQAYNSNDFDQAQVLLEQSLQLDEGNASAQALLGNVQVVMGGVGGEGQGDETQARRVRELARARAVDTELEQREVQKKAEEALRAGDLEEAEKELARLEEMTRELSRFEQSESVEQRMLLEETARQLEDTRGKLAKKQKATAPVSVTQTSSSTAVVGGSMGWSAGRDEIEEIPDRFVQLILEDEELEAPVASAEPQPYPEPEPRPESVPYPEEFAELDALHALGYVEEEAGEEYWTDDEVYFEDLDVEDYDYDEPSPDYAVQTASVESYRRGGRVGGAVRGVVQGAGRSVGRLFSQPKAETNAAPAQSAPAPARVDVHRQQRTDDHRQAEHDRRQAEEGRRVEYKPHTVIDFESVTIEGELIKPQGQLLLDDASARWAGSGPSEPLVMDFGTQAAGRPPASQPGPIESLDDILAQAEGQGLFRGELDLGERSISVEVQASADAGVLSGLAVGTDGLVGVFGAATGLEAELTGGIGGLIGAKGTQTGSGGLGSRGSGLGGGGTAEGLGGLGTRGRGSGASGYGAGAGGGSFGAKADAPPPPPPEPTPSPEPSASPIAFGPPPATASGYGADGANMTGRQDARLASARGNAASVAAPRPPPPPGGTTTLPAPSQTVSAAHLTINIPKAGERLAFEQLLVAENEPLTIDIRYRTRSRR